jgi:hypothetical protein
MSARDPDVAEANRLYWETEASVASIADQLDVSRRALYDAVQPLSAGEVCTSCGAQLTFENRSARKLGVAVCPACGAEQQLAALESAPEGAADSPALAVVRPDSRADRVVDFRDPALRHRAVVLGGAAIAGVALGTVAAMLALRRD